MTRNRTISDGISEDIIAALSKQRWFFGIARNSSFTYRGKQVHLTQIAEGLGVGYVVDGSVRKSGDRVRITVQLSDVTTGSHLWAERDDRVHAQRKSPESLSAWDLVMRAHALSTLLPFQTEMAPGTKYRACARRLNPRSRPSPAASSRAARRGLCPSVASR